MSKPIGSTSTVRIPLKTLIEKLGKFDGVSVSVGKRWLAGVTETFGVDFEAEASEAGATSTPAPETRPTAVVD